MKEKGFSAVNILLSFAIVQTILVSSSVSEVENNATNQASQQSVVDELIRSQYNSSIIWSKLVSSSNSVSLYNSHLKHADKLRRAYIKDKSTLIPGKIDNVKQLVKDCDTYTKRGALNDNITCANGLLARSGVEYLRQFLPPTNDIAGYAKLRILDSFTLASGVDACEFTDNRDGRHFFPLDLLKMRVIAEGVIDVFEEADSEDANHKPPARMPVYEFLVSENRTKELAETRDVGHDFLHIIRKAFKHRHIVFAGDSTTCCMRHNFVAYLLAVNSNQTDQEASRKVLLTLTSNSSANDTNTTNEEGMNATSRSIVVYEDVVQSELIFNIVKQACPQSVTSRKQPFVGDKCSYVGITKCFGAMGCLPDLVLDEDIATSVLEDVHTNNGGALSVLVPNLMDSSVMRGLVRLQQNEAKQHLIFTKQMKSGKREKRKTIAIVHGGLHYFHLFPVRPYFKLFGLNLGHYKENMISLLNAVRKHVGPDGLVIWVTAGNVCDDRLEGTYQRILTKLKEGFLDIAT